MGLGERQVVYVLTAVAVFVALSASRGEHSGLRWVFVAGVTAAAYYVANAVVRRRG